jgi:hypothetical protein
MKPGRSCGFLVDNITDIHDISTVIVKTKVEDGVVRELGRLEGLKIGGKYLVVCKSGEVFHVKSTCRGCL